MTTVEEFFEKTDSEIEKVKFGAKRYVYMIQVSMPCTEEEFREHYSQYTVEMRKCRSCRGNKWDIIMLV